MEELLELYARPDLYDLVHRSHGDDTPFYRRLATEAERPVIELGAGTGRISLAMAESGAEVIAVDRSDSMLARLRERLASRPELASRVTVKVRDLTRVDPVDTDLVVCPARTLNHLNSLAELTALGVRLARGCRHKARFAFDVYLFHADVAALDGETHEQTYDDPDQGIVRSTERLSALAAGRRIRLHHDWVDRDGAASHTMVHFNLWTAEEIQLALADAGWIMTHDASDFVGTPREDGDLSWVTIFRRV